MNLIEELEKLKTEHGAKPCETCTTNNTVDSAIVIAKKYMLTREEFADARINTKINEEKLKALTRSEE